MAPLRQDGPRLGVDVYLRVEAGRHDTSRLCRRWDSIGCWKPAPFVSVIVGPLRDLADQGWYVAQGEEHEHLW